MQATNLANKKKNHSGIFNCFGFMFSSNFSISFEIVCYHKPINLFGSIVISLFVVVVVKNAFAGTDNNHKIKI